MIARAALAVLLLVASCGGGGSGPSSSGSIVPAPALRTDLLFGYYGENGSAVTETADHANLAWCADFYGPLEQMACLTQAKGLGKRAVVMVPAYSAPCVPTAPANLDFWFQRLANAGLLWDGIVAVYPADEPACEDAMVRAVNAMVRASMATFPALAHAQLAVIYACKAGFPGADAYDLIGCDDYDSGCAVFSRYYAALTAANPRAQWIDVPGGADPWRQDPACFESHAHGTPQVWALVPFLWQSADGHAGIRDNPTRALYCDAGRKIVGGAPC